MAHDDRVGGGAGNLPPSREPAAQDPQEGEARKVRTEGKMEVLQGGVRGLAHSTGRAPNVTHATVSEPMKLLKE